MLRKYSASVCDSREQVRVLRVFNMKPTGPTNPNLQALIRELRLFGFKQNVPLWSRIADDLERSTRKRREVNVDRINKYTEANELVIVPGKVLSNGELDHKVTVAAFRFSADAESKINKQGKAISIQTLMKENPKAKGVRIIG